MIDRAREFELFLHQGKLLPAAGDRHDYLVEFEVRDRHQRESNGPASGRIRVGISDTLKTQWRIPDDRLEACLLRLAVNYLSHRIKSGFLIPEEELQLTTYNAPPDPPFDPNQEELNFGPYSILT